MYPTTGHLQTKPAKFCLNESKSLSKLRNGLIFVFTRPFFYLGRSLKLISFCLATKKELTSRYNLYKLLHEVHLFLMGKQKQTNKHYTVIRLEKPFSYHAYQKYAWFWHFDIHIDVFRLFFTERPPLPSKKSTYYVLW